jgi:ABC-type multidrug transport system fused ATPase/permease subunit
LITLNSALLRSLVSVFWLRFFIAGVLKFIFDTCNLLSPFFLRFLLQDIQNPYAPVYEGYLWSVGLFALQIFATFLTHHYFNIVMSKVGLQVCLKNLCLQKRYEVYWLQKFIKNLVNSPMQPDSEEQLEKW